MPIIYIHLSIVQTWQLPQQQSVTMTLLQQQRQSLYLLRQVSWAIYVSLYNELLCVYSSELLCVYLFNIFLNCFVCFVLTSAGSSFLIRFSAHRPRFSPASPASPYCQHVFQNAFVIICSVLWLHVNIHTRHISVP